MAHTLRTGGITYAPLAVLRDLGITWSAPTLRLKEAAGEFPIRRQIGLACYWNLADILTLLRDRADRANAAVTLAETLIDGRA